MATDETRAEASNPGTSPTRLQELTSDSELWPLIAANPNAYDALLTWLGENGGPEVQSAIASRGGAAEPTSVLPSAPPSQAGPPLTPPPGGNAFPPPGGATPPPAGFPAPGGPQGGSGGSKKGLWITLGILVFLLVGSGIAVGVWALTKGDDSDNDNDASDTEPTDEPTEDSDRDDSDRDEDSSDFCDVIDEVDDAAFDIYLYLPSLDEPEDLEESQAVLEDNVDDAPSDVADAMEVLIDYADLVADIENLSDIPTDAADDASDAYDVVFEYYLDC
ncbi:variant leucine-rich repeat-containing protein [Aeromicrobium sp. Sec7.5]|uniref:variant leucine-rich repeat-containing protein n=1 Tax=Aeromicrobium sp. Sec7.5 TaxID=3121276 RepID=UPI002FE46B0F